VIALLTAGDFLGEGCISSGAPKRMATATTMSATTTVEIKKDEMIRVLHEQKEFADRFISYMLKRNVRIEADLVDQLFNFSEKRLRVLFSSLLVMEKKASLNQSLARYRRKRWPNWWGRRAVASMFS
jgi:CRP-like cAMP-binding protein